MKPLLQEEEERTAFDIHSYGKTIIELAEQELRRTNPKNEDSLRFKATVDFRDLTKGRQQYEVCRMFLAALSLTNSGNVHIQGSLNCDALEIDLLSTEIERPMKTYLAPSAAAGKASVVNPTFLDSEDEM